MQEYTQALVDSDLFSHTVGPEDEYQLLMRVLTAGTARGSYEEMREERLGIPGAYRVRSVIDLF